MFTSRCSKDKLEQMVPLEVTSNSPSPVPSIPESISDEELGDEIVIKEQQQLKTDLQNEQDVIGELQASGNKRTDEVLICDEKLYPNIKYVNERPILFLKS